MTALTDGLSGLANDQERLTTCACWRVRFDRYSYHPVVVVPFDTGLDRVEALARRDLLDYLLRDEPNDEWLVSRTRTVATLRVLAVERQDDVALDPSLG